MSGWKPSAPVTVTSPSLGDIVEAIRHLAPDDRRDLFTMVNALYPSALGANAPSGPFGPATGVPVIRGPSGSQQPPLVAPGYTSNPATGKVYRVVPPRVHTSDRIAIETDLAKARKSLNDFLVSVGAERSSFDEKTGEQSKPVLPNGTSAADAAKAKGLHEALVAARTARDNHKLSNPDQYPEPPKKGGSRQRGG
jgi:hypothetical protein